MIRTVAYVLTSFPQPSETFIADELLSLYGEGVKPFILHINDGNRVKVHPSSQTLLEKASFFRLGKTSKLEAIWSLAFLLTRMPFRTIHTLGLALRHPFRWCYIQALPAAKWCLSQNIEFLHAHFADINFVYASAISAWTGIPYGVTTHRYDIFDDPLNKSITIDLFKWAAVTITISEFNRDYMIKKYGPPTSKIHIVHCGIDLNRFRFEDRMQRKMGPTLRILNIGRLFPEKAQDILLTAMALVKARGVPFTLEIIGGGPMEAELTQMTEALGLKDEVVFHGTQTEAFVRERLATVELFVLSSRNEGLPVVLMEALAMGTPVIATRIFGIPELIKDGVSGMLVPPDDPKALADAICSIYSNQTLLSSLTAAGRRVVEAEFDRGACTRQLVQLWSKAILGTRR